MEREDKIIYNNVTGVHANDADTIRIRKVLFSSLRPFPLKFKRNKKAIKKDDKKFDIYVYLYNNRVERTHTFIPVFSINTKIPTIQYIIIFFFNNFIILWIFTCATSFLYALKYSLSCAFR